MTEQAPPGPASEMCAGVAEGGGAHSCPDSTAPTPQGPREEHPRRAAVMFPKMQRYIDVLACRAFGDSVEYDAFLRAKAHAGCAESRLVLEAVDFVAGINALVGQLLQRLEQAKCTRVVAMCEAVRRTPTMPQREVLFWNLCSVSGVPSRHGLEIPSETARALVVDISFAAFVRTFWVLMHLPAIEQNRVSLHTRAGVESKNIATDIKQFQAGKHFASHRDIWLYCQACVFVIDTLEATSHKMGV